MRLLLLARVTPLLPSGLITLIAALSTVKFFDFIIVTLIGKAPSIAMETLIGHDLIRLNENLPRLLISIVIIFLLVLALRPKKKR